MLRPWQINFLVMCVHVLVFYIVCSIVCSILLCLWHTSILKYLYVLNNLLEFLVNTNIFGSKGYSRYTMITSHNVSSESHVKFFFYVPFWRYSSFCSFNRHMIYQICDITTSISTWDGVHFWICLSSPHSLSHQLWPIDRYKEEQ